MKRLMTVLACMLAVAATSAVSSAQAPERTGGVVAQKANVYVVGVSGMT